MAGQGDALVNPATGLNAGSSQRRERMPLPTAPRCLRLPPPSQETRKRSAVPDGALASSTPWTGKDAHCLVDGLRVYEGRVGVGLWSFVSRGLLAEGVSENGGT